MHDETEITIKLADDRAGVPVVGVVLGDKNIGLTPQNARKAAEQLLRIASYIDGGKVEQASLTWKM